MTEITDEMLEAQQRLMEDMLDRCIAQSQRLRASHDALLAALTDMLSGWRYIRTHHGDLDGVGWDRCEDAARAAVAAAERV